MKADSLSLSTGPAAFEGEAPAGGARSTFAEMGASAEAGAGIERDMGAGLRGDPPARERAGDLRLAMTGEEEAWRAGGAGGEPKTPGGELRLDLGLGQACDQGGAFQPFFQSPGGFVRGVCLDDKDARRVEASLEEARSVRASPFLGVPLRHAPQHRSRTLLLDVGNHGQGKPQPRRRVAIGMGLDLVQPCLVQRAQRAVRSGIRCVGGRRRRRQRAGGTGRGRTRRGGDA